MNKDFWTKAEIAIKRFWFKITGQKRKYFRVGKCLRCGKCCRNNSKPMEKLKMEQLYFHAQNKMEIFVLCMTNDLKFAEIIQIYI